MSARKAGKALGLAVGVLVAAPILALLLTLAFVVGAYRAIWEDAKR